MTKKYLLSKIGAAPPEIKLVVDDQDSFDIMKQVSVKHKKCAEYYDRIAMDFYSPYIMVTCRKLFDFCKDNIAYKEETIDRQFTSSPQTILLRGFGDCKSYALFIGGVLDALKRRGVNINWCYRFASENFSNEHAQPGHVFIVVNTGQGEIWVDPVLYEFNQDHDFASWQDRKVNVSASKISGCDCSAIGATTSQTGAAIMKLAPALAAVPVAAAVVELAGAVINIFGSKHEQGTDVLWLVQLYQQNVLGQKGVTATNANDLLTQQAQAWFSLVLGVPVGGRSDFNYLQSGVGDSNTVHFTDPSVRANNYLDNLVATQTRPTVNAAIDAAVIATTKMNPYAASPGSWANMTAAPSLIGESDPYNPSANPSLAVNANGSLITTGVSSNNNILILAAVVVAALFLIK
jgi:hypothetical protein